MRLLMCAVAVAVTILSVTSALALERQIGSWRYMEFKDAITDQTNGGMALRRSDPKGAELILKCNSRRPQIVISFEGRTFKEERAHWIALRINTNEPLLLIGKANRNTSAIAIAIPRSVYPTLSAASAISVRVFETERQHDSYRFVAQKTEAAFSYYSKLCPMDATVGQEPLPYDASAPVPPVPADGRIPDSLRVRPPT